MKPDISLEDISAWIGGRADAETQRRIEADLKRRRSIVRASIDQIAKPYQPSLLERVTRFIHRRIARLADLARPGLGTVIQSEQAPLDDTPSAGIVTDTSSPPRSGWKGLLNGQTFGHDRATRGTSWVEVAAVAGIALALAAMIIPALRSAREAARRAYCTNNLKQIVIGMGFYQMQFEHFLPSMVYPSASSWNGWSPTVHLNLLAELDQPTLWNSYNYDAGLSPANSTVFGARVNAYICPSDRQSRGGPQINYLATNGGVMPGNGMFRPLIRSDKISQNEKSVYEKYKLFFLDDVLTFVSMRDGASNTAAFSERLIGPGEIEPVRYGQLGENRLRVYYPTGLRSIDSAVMIEPGSLGSPLLNACIGLPTGTRSAGGLRRGRWFISHPKLSYPTYNHIMTPNSQSCSNLVIDPPALDYWGAAPPSSNHPGGVNLGFADGSVRFIENTIDLRVWQALGTIHGGEVIPPGSY